MKKLLALLLALCMVFSLAACGGEAAADNKETAANTEAHDHDHDHDHEEETPSTVTVETVYGPVEVPYAPERICVLDLSTMDTIDALGLGENVAILSWHKHYPAHLEGYYTSETIISLQTARNNNKGNSAEATNPTEETTDPNEVYYGIDADLIIGTNEKITEELYAILSQIAPTVTLEPALECADGIYAGMRANAVTVASIWGLDVQLEELDAQYAALCAAMEGKTFVMASGDTELSSLKVANAENAESGMAEGKNKKSNTVNAVQLLEEMGMVEVTTQVPQDVTSEAIAAAVEAGTSNEDAAKMVIDGINSIAPDVVVIWNHSYVDLEDVRANGFDLLGVEDLTGGTCYISKGIGYAAGGLTSVTQVLNELADIFLN